MDKDIKFNEICQSRIKRGLLPRPKTYTDYSFPFIAKNVDDVEKYLTPAGLGSGCSVLRFDCLEIKEWRTLLNRLPEGIIFHAKIQIGNKEIESLWFDDMPYNILIEIRVTEDCLKGRLFYENLSKFSMSGIQFYLVFINVSGSLLGKYVGKMEYGNGFNVLDDNHRIYLKP